MPDLLQDSATLHKLQERVKELTCLHKTARLLQDDERPVRDVVRDVVALLPAAWQYPEVAAARIRFRDINESTHGFQVSQFSQAAAFLVQVDSPGIIEVVYLAPRPLADEGPFLNEERELIQSLAEMLRSFFQHRLATEAVQSAYDNLEILVQERTQELRRLATELSLAEARKNREIAVDLHDHVIQEFAFIKLRVLQFRGDAVFCGFEQRFDEIIALLERAIQFTRKLTFEISTPILYELGLPAALEWLAEQYAQRHSLHIEVSVRDQRQQLPEEIRITLFRCVQELLTNVVKYAQAKCVAIEVSAENFKYSITATDDGAGFDTRQLEDPSKIREGFGLFSIRERLRYFGGTMSLNSTIGRGTTVVLYVPVEPK